MQETINTSWIFFQISSFFSPIFWLSPILSSSSGIHQENQRQYVPATRIPCRGRGDPVPHQI